MGPPPRHQHGIRTPELGQPLGRSGLFAPFLKHPLKETIALDNQKHQADHSPNVDCTEYPYIQEHLGQIGRHISNQGEEYHTKEGQTQLPRHTTCKHNSSGSGGRKPLL